MTTFLFSREVSWVDLQKKHCPLMSFNDVVAAGAASVAGGVEMASVDEVSRDTKAFPCVESVLID